MAATAFSTTSTAALPTTTPSAKLATARAAPGVLMPKPTATGSLPPVRALIARHLRARLLHVGQVRAGDAGQRHVVDEPARDARRDVDARRRRGRRQQRDEVEPAAWPAPSSARRPRRPGSRRTARRRRPPRRRLGERLVTHHDDRVRVAEQDDADVRVRLRAARATAPAPCVMPPPLASARCIAAWITLPSADGSLQGTPISMMSAPASAAAMHQPPAGLVVGILRGQVDDQRGALLRLRAREALVPRRLLTASRRGARRWSPCPCRPGPRR